MIAMKIQLMCKHGNDSVKEGKVDREWSTLAATKVKSLTGKFGRLN